MSEENMDVGSCGSITFGDVMVTPPDCYEANCENCLWKMSCKRVVGEKTFVAFPVQKMGCSNIPISAPSIGLAMMNRNYV